MHIDVENQSGQQTPGQQAPEQEQNGEQQKRIKYKIDWKKFGTLIGGLVLLLAIAGGIWLFFWGRDKSEGDDPVKVYDVAVMLKDQTNSNSEEDARSSLKAGDVALARETGREWSNTEKISFLILKMKLKQSEAEKLTEPETKKLTEKEAKEQGILPEKYKVVSEKQKLEDDKKQPAEEKEREMLLTKQEFEQMLTVPVRARHYRINFEELDFDPMKVREAQPFPDREFGWEIVERK